MSKQNDMLGSLMRALVTVPMGRLGVILDLTHKLGGQDGDVWEKEAGLFLRKQPTWTDGGKDSVLVTKSDLINWLGTVPIPASTEAFIANERFKLKRDGGICSYFGNNFNAWFLKGKGKIESSFAGSTLRYGKLRRSATDKPQKSGAEGILPALGGEEKAETTLTEVFHLMTVQGDGNGGTLHTNGKANLFYIRDQAGVLRTVYVYWNDGGWDVSAGSVEDPCEWGGGGQVFARNSELKSSEPPVPAQA